MQPQLFGQVRTTSTFSYGAFLVLEHREFQELRHSIRYSRLCPVTFQLSAGELSRKSNNETAQFFLLQPLAVDHPDVVTGMIHR